MIFRTFFYSQNCLSLGNTFCGHPNCSQQDKATFLVMCPLDFSSPLIHIVILPLSKASEPKPHTASPGRGAEFTGTALPTLPAGCRALCLTTLVSSNSTIKSASNVFSQLSLASSSHLPTPEHSLCAYLRPDGELHITLIVPAPPVCFQSSLTG